MAFKKGESGCPSGRPAGKTPGAKIRKAIEAKSDAILKSVIDAAVAGDMSACKMLLDRITPPLKPVATQVTLSLPDGAGLAEQGAAVIHAALSGVISSDIAHQLVGAISAQTKIVEIDEILKRIDALEQKK